MKKTLLTIGVTALTVTGFAQNSFSGKNLGGSAVNGEDGNPLSKLTGKIELLDGTKVLAAGSFIKDGFFALGTIDGGAGTTLAVTVRAWDSTLGATFAAAKATGHGYGSSVVSVALASSTTPPSDLTAGGFAGFSLVKATASVPEPSTIALAALGLGGLMFISRRK